MVFALIGVLTLSGLGAAIYLLVKGEDEPATRRKAPPRPPIPASRPRPSRTTSASVRPAAQPKQPDAPVPTPKRPAPPVEPLPRQVTPASQPKQSAKPTGAPPEPKANTMSAKSGWYPDPDGKGGQRYFDGSRWTDARIAGRKPTPWASVPTAGWIGLALLGAVVIVVVAVLAASSDSRDSESYRYGQDQVSPLAKTLLDQGISGTEYACQQAADMTTWTDKRLVKEDVIAGCADALGK